MIELQNLTKTYYSSAGEITALKGVNLTVRSGEIYGIIGLSGAGKSTLVRCINLLEKPTSGSVFIDGEDLTKVSPKRLREIRRNIGMIFQSFNLLEQRTVYENVSFSLEIAGVKKSERAKKINSLLRITGLEDKAKAYPSQLSGGQKQRVAIARALATNPEYLLCDEATSALDPTTTRSILELLKSVNEKLGVTVVVITHEMKVVESICSKVAVIDNGAIAEEGETSEVLSDPKSEIAKKLVLPEAVRNMKVNDGEYKFRLIFDGENSGLPVISALAIERGIAANIVYADTKTIDGKLFGHLVFTLKSGEEDFLKTKEFLTEKGVKYIAEGA